MVIMPENKMLELEALALNGDVNSDDDNIEQYKELLELEDDE
jgi:hypothetical protein